ncbi:zinc ribbon domain-containing protein [Patescibacteria group bacterium]|nr:zinc ribbon domain-containing protein [Patescibacteria group bacterium]
MSQKFYPVTCQSCGMPMKIDSDFGTNADKSKNEEYCTYCFKDGSFTNSGITMNQMIAGCVGIMVKFGTPEVAAKEQMEKLIPTLKRWRKA